jgi:4-coumarate--CoA ligase
MVHLLSKLPDWSTTDTSIRRYITDRVKELIKFKGFQVAPAELEGILASHDMVDDVAVIGIQDESQATEVPMACIVPKKGIEGNRENEEVIVAWLREKVAAHKRLRGGVTWVDEVPKSASGKILRRVLKDKYGKTAVKAKL